MLPGLLHAEALSSDTPDWPCVQVLVPEVPPAVVWAGPSIAGKETLWKQDEAIGRLVKRFVSSDYNVENSDKEIAEFAAQLKPELKDKKLTLLFAGVIESLNDKRKKDLIGIIRYARGQAERARSLSQELDEMVDLQDDPSAEARERLALMQSEMEIKQRMFDDREASIQHLCARPQVIEEKLGILARNIAYHLD
jgi:hypothetical protein